MNKIDRPRRAHQVIDEVFGLMVDLGATDAQLDFPSVRPPSGFARRGWIHTNGRSAPPRHVLVESPPGGDAAALQLLVASLGYDNYLRRLVIGRVVNRTIRPAQQSLPKLDGAA